MDKKQAAEELLRMASEAGSAEMPSATHTLKTWQQYLEPVMLGKKKFEIRQADRDYKVGDTLLLLGVNNFTNNATGCWCKCRVTYIFTGGENDPFRIIATNVSGDQKYSFDGAYSFNVVVMSIEVLDWHFEADYVTEAVELAEFLKNQPDLLWRNKPSDSGAWSPRPLASDIRENLIIQENMPITDLLLFDHASKHDTKDPDGVAEFIKDYLNDADVKATEDEGDSREGS